MEYLQFAQQTGNPQVYSNKYIMQNSPILTKFKPCDQGLSPQAEAAFLQEKTGQTLLINNNAQKNQLLGMSNEYVGSMQQYQPIVTVPLQTAHLYQQQPLAQQKRDDKYIHFLFIILIIFIAVNIFTYMKLQKVEYRLKYGQNQGISQANQSIPM